MRPQAAVCETWKDKLGETKSLNLCSEKKFSAALATGKCIPTFKNGIIFNSAIHIAAVYECTLRKHLCVHEKN